MRQPSNNWVVGYVWLACVVWTAVVGGSLLLSLYQQRHGTLESARRQAQTAFEKDFAYRRWAGHGGGYVPVTEQTRPHSYLKDLPHRDVEATFGNLTLINPALICRQVYEIESESHGIRSRIISLKPIRPENIADAWEAEALRAFVGDTAEVSSVEQMDGRLFMRMIRPLFTDSSCLACHPDHEVGDIRGGISVSIPMKPLRKILRLQMVMLSLGHSLLWVGGMVGIVFTERRLNQHIERRFAAEEALHDQESRLQILTEHNARLRAERTLANTNRELRIAAAIQKNFLPSAPPTLGSLDIAGFWHPADEVGGDFYDYLPMCDGYEGVIIADVSGHGIASALTMAETYAYMRALTEKSSDMDEILSRVNTLLSSPNPRCCFVTLFLARFDPRNQTLVYAGAGHQAYLFDDGGRPTVLESTGPPLGVAVNTVAHVSATLQLHAGQIILLMTDGIWEACDLGGIPFGIEHVLELVHEHQNLCAREIVEKVFQVVRDFTKGQAQADDMTAVIVKVQ